MRVKNVEIFIAVVMPVHAMAVQLSTHARQCPATTGSRIASAPRIGDSLNDDAGFRTCHSASRSAGFVVAAILPLDRQRLGCGALDGWSGSDAFFSSMTGA